MCSSHLEPGHRLNTCITNKVPSSCGLPGSPPILIDWKGILPADIGNVVPGLEAAPVLHNTNETVGT